MDIFGLVDVPWWLLTTLVVLALSIWYNFGIYTHFSKYGIDGPTPYPFVGNLVTALRMGFLQYDIEMYKKYKNKGCYGMFLWSTKPTLTVTDVDMMKEVLVKQFNKFTNRRNFSRNRYPMNKMMTGLRDDHWKHIRNMTTPTFTSGKLRNMMGLIRTAGEQLALNMKDKSDKNEDVDLRKMCGCFTMDVVASTLFGIQVDSLKNPNHEFVQNADQVFKITLGSPKVILSLMFPRLGQILSKFGLSLIDWSVFIYLADVCAQALEQRRETQGQYHDFLDIMMKDEVPDDQIDRKTEYPFRDGLEWSSKGILRDEIVAQAVIFFLAGYDTTANTLHFLLYRLAMDQDIQEKVLQESDEVLGDGEITYESANKLDYLDMCIQETLRMYPPAFRFERMASEDVVINGITITKDTNVSFPTYAIHYDPEIYPDPHTFNPLRFTEEEKAKRSQYHWTPFGIGPRNCVGMRLALLEMKIAAAAILRKCRFTPASSTPEPENIKFAPGSVRPKTPIIVKVEVRQ